MGGAINIRSAFVFVRHHPGDDQRDTGVHGEEDDRRHPGAAETRRGSQPARLSGSHAGKKQFQLG